MIQPPLVQVLLGTYNGARFLRPQVDSILAQTYERLEIVARDDGSSDGTRVILEDYAARLPERFRLLPESPASGNAKFNFMQLLAAADAPYLAFADQDDVWLPGKIALSLEAMQKLESEHNPDKPLLVFSDLRVVDSELKTLDESFWHSQHIQPGQIHSLRRLVMQNVVTGCTMLFNRALQQASLPMPASAFMHDWWIALIACCFGKSAFLSETTILYRQHGGNVLGAPTPPPAIGIPRWRIHRERRRYWELAAQQAEALLTTQGSLLSSANRHLLQLHSRCEHSPNRLVRVLSFLRGGFFLNGLRANLALLWYLWDMKYAKEDGGEKRLGAL